MNIHRQEMKKSQGIFLFFPPFRVSGRLKNRIKGPKTDSKSLLFSFDILP